MEIKENLTTKEMKILVNSILKEESEKENIEISSNPVTIIEWYNSKFFKKKMKIADISTKINLITSPLYCKGITFEGGKTIFIYLNGIKKAKKIPNTNPLITLLTNIYHEFEHTRQNNLAKFTKTEVKQQEIDDNKILLDIPIPFEYVAINIFERIIINEDNNFYNKHHNEFLMEIDASLYCYIKTKEFLQKHNKQIYEKYKYIINSNIIENEKNYENYDFNLIFEKFHQIYQNNTDYHHIVLDIIYEKNSTKFNSITDITNSPYLDKKTAYHIITSRPFLKQLDFDNLDNNELKTLIDALKYISLPKEELLKIPINILEHLEKPDQKRKIHKRHN